eukprot:2535108-Alexandrium_andersonii.AAC.1
MGCPQRRLGLRWSQRQRPQRLAVSEGRAPAEECGARLPRWLPHSRRQHLQKGPWLNLGCCLP